MNTTEHLVETYYRVIKYNLTTTDFKVIGGNNRQLDVLAFDLIKKQFRHIEVSVTHYEHWTANLDKVGEEIGFKFFGQTKNKRPENLKTDYNKGKNYKKAIEKSYAQFGVDWDKVIRVWCLWRYEETPKEIDEWKRDLSKKFGVKHDKFEILSLRDEIIPNLLDAVGTSNYSDEIMRTLSLIKQYNRQKKESKIIAMKFWLEKAIFVNRTLFDNLTKSLANGFM